MGCGASTVVPQQEVDNPPLDTRDASGSSTNQSSSSSGDSKLSRSSTSRATSGTKMKVLVLGPSDVGKTTITKQLVARFGQQLSEEERKGYIPQIHHNLIVNTQLLCSQVKKYANGLMRPDAYSSWHAILNLTGHEPVTQEIGYHVLKLWNDPAVQRVYEARSEIQLQDSAAYFVSRVPELVQPGYVPSMGDILCSRVRSTGIVENEIWIDGRHFSLVDVGGSRSERAKWPKCYQHTVAVMFVAALSAFDMRLQENEKTNRMEEALSLFENLCAEPALEGCCFVLILNKVDVFEDMLAAGVQVSDHFPDYHGPNQAAPAADWFRTVFEARSVRGERPARAIYTHVVTAVDPDSAPNAFLSVQNSIVRKALKASGVLH